MTDATITGRSSISGAATVAADATTIKPTSTVAIAIITMLPTPASGLFGHEALRRADWRNTLRASSLARSRTSWVKQAIGQAVQVVIGLAHSQMQSGVDLSRTGLAG